MSGRKEWHLSYHYDVWEDRMTLVRLVRCLVTSNNACDTATVSGKTESHLWHCYDVWEYTLTIVRLLGCLGRLTDTCETSMVSGKTDWHLWDIYNVWEDWLALVRLLWSLGRLTLVRLLRCPGRLADTCETSTMSVKTDWHLWDFYDVWDTTNDIYETVTMPGRTKNDTCETVTMVNIERYLCDLWCLGHKQR